jgi:transposase
METLRAFLTKHTARRWATACGKCANTSFTPAPVAHPLPTLEKSRRTACRTAPTTRTTEGTPTMELTYQQVYPTNSIQARKRIVHIYQQTQNYCETAPRCHTSPQRVRKWVKRDQQYGEQALHNLPKTQKRQPRKTDLDLEQRVRQRHQKTHYGRQRLARHLAPHGIHLSPNTIGICRFDACSVVGQYSVRLVASGLASCQRCVDPLRVRQTGNYRRISDAVMML